MLPAKDISRWQGTWQDTGEPIVMIKMSGGDDGLYMDSQATNNYESAVKAGKAVGGYHFIGWVAGSVAEANYFLQSMRPLAENDVYALDIEAIVPGIDPVAYVTDMVNTIHDKINVYPLLYINLSTLRAHDWSPLLKLCGLWLADWNNDPNSTIPNIPIYVMQQYSDGPNYDHDEWFGTIDQFKAYGYHAPVPPPPTPQPSPEPAPDPTPIPQPTPDPVRAPQPEPQPKPTPTPQPSPTPVPAPKPVANNWVTMLLQLVLKLFRRKL